MSRLDQHVGLIRTKIAFGIFLRALAWTGLGLGVAVVLVVLIQRRFAAQFNLHMIWFWIGLGVTIVAPVIYTVRRWPTAHQAAVTIDERLGLKEVYSTALYVRSSVDPFAAAAAHVAEKTADKVSLQRQFPVRYPVAGIWTIVVAIVALCEITWLPQSVPANPDTKTIDSTRHAGAEHPPEHFVRAALAEIDNAPKQVAENEQIKMAREELSKMLQQPIADAPRAREKAQDTLNQIAALKQKIAEANKFVAANNELNALKDITPPSPQDTGPVSDAQRAMAAGKLDDAIDTLKKTVDNFDKMDKKEQDKAAEQMKNLAQQIAKQANNPKVQQQIQKQLQQAGATQQQAQQMQNLMQQAANGNQQAAQQLQQMANQAIQQSNQQAGISQQQQKAIAQAMQQAVQQGQQQSNGQASAQQMAQTAQNLANAMKQAAQGQQQAQQGQGHQGQQPGQQGQQPGQQGQQAQAKGQQGQQAGQQGQQAQAGQQQGQQGQQNGQGQGQQNAQQQMQQQIAQMQAMAKDAQAVAAGQQGQGQQGQGQGQQGQGQGQGQGGQGQQANGQWGQGQQGGNGQPGNPQQGQGGQGGGQGAGGARPDPVAVPFQVKQELSISETIESGKIIANTFVKAPAERGESKIKLSEAIASQTKDEAGEVEADRIPRGAQKAVKDYFDTLKQDQGK